MAAPTQGGRRENSRPPQWKRRPERAGGVRAAAAGDNAGRRYGRRVELGAVAVEEAAEASRTAPPGRHRE